MQRDGDEFIVAPLARSLAFLKLALTQPAGSQIGSEKLEGIRQCSGGMLLFRFVEKNGRNLYIEVRPLLETEESIRKDYEKLPTPSIGGGPRVGIRLKGQRRAA